MYVKKLQAKNFRNILEQEINFQRGINVFYGKNASGKTNALEAIYLFASGKSLRGSFEKDFINKNSDSAKIAIEYVTDTSFQNARNMSLTFLGNNRKIMKYGYSDIPKMSEFLGHFRACVFTPDDLSLVKAGPEERRRFADISISQISPKFVHCLNDYHKILAQKNAVLKNAQLTGKLDKQLFEILNFQLCTAAAVIVKQRAGLFEKLSEYASEIYRNISDDREFFGMKYISQTKKEYQDENYTKKAYHDLLNKNQERELKYGVSLIGPHKDDVYFYVGKGNEIKESDETTDELTFGNGFSAKAFGSRGQQRSVVLSLKLSQGELFRELCGEYPVFLLDDVFSELDSGRRNYILSDIDKKQIIITCCDCDIFGNFKNYNRIFVEEGTYGEG